MGDVKGSPEEWTEREMNIDKPFWMASCEITNAQFKAFNNQHDSRYYGKRHAGMMTEVCPWMLVTNQC